MPEDEELNEITSSAFVQAIIFIVGNWSIGKIEQIKSPFENERNLHADSLSAGSIYYYDI